ncbi:MAG: Gldg family protein, partial [Chitinophagaceae bacterium]
LKPQTPFTDSEKLRIDQYVMHGGKILWAFSPVNASMDSLQKQSSFFAYDKGLNLSDILFNYGVRINADLVQDLQCFSIPITVGSLGNRPQIEQLPWPFDPLLTPQQNNPITKNMDVVLSQFPSSIDTTAATGIRKTVLLATSPFSRTIGTPFRVSLESEKVKPDPRLFIKQHIPVAVLLQGTFPSIFRDRLNDEMLANIQMQFHHPYKSQSSDTRMIVVSDGNMFLNAVSQQNGPLEMGMDPYTRQLFANREFFENCLTYLTDTTGIIQARNKDFKLRLLDKNKIEQQKATWQVIDFLIPIAFVLLFAVIFQFVRQRKFAE